MNIEQAKILARHVKVADYNSVIVCSDGQIFLNGDVEAINKHCQDNGLEAHDLKDASKSSRPKKHSK